MVLRLPTWKALRAYKLLNAQFGLKQMVRRAIPLGIHALAARTSDYENAIRARWNQAKPDIARRGDVAVTEFIDWLVDLAYRNMSFDYKPPAGAVVTPSDNSLDLSGFSVMATFSYWF